MAENELIEEDTNLPEEAEEDLATLPPEDE